MSALPLTGKRILVTRAAHQAQSFVRLLEAQGATAITCPLIEIVAPASWQRLDEALARLQDYDDLILTSVNAVDMVFSRLGKGVVPQTALDGVRLVCVGPKTAKSLQHYGYQPDLQPDEYRAEAVVAALTAEGVRGRKVLYPRAELARDLIPSSLTQAGAEVDDPIAYRTLPAKGSALQIRGLLDDKAVDVVTFSSSSSVDNFVDLLGDDVTLLTRHVVLASIGPLTTATAVKHGLAIEVEPAEYTLDGLVQALIDYFNPSGHSG
ncbi:uroporphyrinogen-III synthase [Desulfuromonas acetoxidans]|uniref:Uroporphyrinogen III synthase HEM4 n=1 Tax=Desulfuromonas acetoxidans (strain DSM 684 / 11070) TaxID=281689 RepID=Q1JVU0_DESA6|nr:uroporphyrinogen-III synthase [Desulfuromonas acetoxidans]EAT14346.1 Uroporphyrinogen III synthase HEM4 [Desulfuromonas acetoxidans DSM 684]MBF0644561.1 uroporphyrinogen-III synthase [Desulfuromonas acetoxidans]NVD23912.1 uroporphyrinogen-III synthase [Desulfuromonas acetoxidans]NVE16209.1 uroporphyrinogen-III synthase [Desulfuromonas acetoxidans]